MAKPVITQPTTPRVIAQGIAIPTLTLVATGSPTGWTATPLPAGLSLDAEAGTISGTPTAAGLVSTTITATNGDGTSAPVTLVWSVQAQPVGAGAWSDLELDLDLIERSVSIPGITREEGAPVFRIARGDKIAVLVGVRKFGVLCDVQPAAEVVSLKLGLKEFEPEILLTLAGGSPVKVGSDDTTRFRIPLWLDPAALSVLSDYEGDEKTELIARAELELTVGNAATTYNDSKSSGALALTGGISEPLEETLVFTGLTATEGASYTLTVALAVPARPGQNLSLVQTMTITFTGGVWVVSDVAGSDSATGPAEGSQWRATLNIDEIAGDADSVDVDLSVTTTSGDAGPMEWEMPFVHTGSGTFDDPDGEIQFSTYSEISLWGAEETQIGGYQTLPSEGTAAYILGEIEVAINTAAGAAIVESIEATTGDYVRIVLAAGAGVEGIGFGESGDRPPTTLNGQLHAPEGEASLSASLSATLSQVPEEGAQPLRYTAQFPIAIIRDMV